MNIFCGLKVKQSTIIGQWSKVGAARAGHHQQRDDDHRLVRDRVQHGAQLRDLLPAARQIAVEPIGDCPILR